MTLHPAYDALRKHHIRFFANTRDWTDDCLECGGKNTLSIHYDDDVTEFRCEACGRSGSERLRPASVQTGGNGPLPRGDDAEDPPKSYSHIWRSKDHDYPCAPTGVEERHDDGRIYARVRTPDGNESFVPKDELIAKDEASFLDAALARLKEKKGLDAADVVQELSEAEKRGYADAVRALRALIKPLPPPSLDAIVECALKENPDGPFSDERLEQFARLKREQVEDFARLCRRYPALAAAVPLDAAAVRTAIENAGKDEVVALFFDLVVVTDLDPIEIDALLRLVAEKSGVRLRPLQAKLKETQKQRAAMRAKAARAKRLAARKDPRPPIDVPAYDAPWLPIADAVNAVLGHVTASAPPERDIDGVATRGRKLAVPKMHAFSQVQANPETEE